VNGANKPGIPFSVAAVAVPPTVRQHKRCRKPGFLPGLLSTPGLFVADPAGKEFLSHSGSGLKSQGSYSVTDVS
jgi:hypothetical protein